LNLLRRLANRTEWNWWITFFKIPREFIQQSKHFRCGYVRCSYLGCKRILLLMVNTEPAKVRAVYESKTFSWAYVYACNEEKSLTATVCLLWEILLGVEDRAVIAFLQILRTTSLQKLLRRWLTELKN
jgi:hypothetical protein